jgi:hypothetical protein
MARKKVWDISAEIAIMTKALNDPKQVGWFRDGALEKINKWLEAERPDCFFITQPLSIYAGWLGISGAVRVYQGDATGWQLLETSLLYRFLSARVRFAVSDQVKKQVPFLTGIEPLVLAHSITARRDDVANWLGNRGLRSYQDSDPQTRSRYRHFVSPVNQYVLRLFALWKQQTVDLDGYSQQSAKPLDDLLSQSFGSVEEYGRHINQACDFCIVQSGKDSTELGVMPYHVFPVLLLASLRVRQELGLPSTLPHHPLLTSDLGRVPVCITTGEDSLLTKVEHRVRAIFSDIGYPF